MLRSSSPDGVTKWLSSMPISAARSFIIAANRSLLPAMRTAAAPAASLPDGSSIP